MKDEVASLVAQAIGADKSAVLPNLEAPKDPKRGDVALPCFKLAKSLGREGKDAPIALARELVAKVPKGSLIAEVSAAGPFVNFRLAPGALAATVLGAIARPGRYGGSDEGAGKTIVIDYSSPNIAKPFHLGHLRTTIIGHTLKQLYESLGYRVVGVNHLGDWGTQFGLMIAAWQRWHADAEARIARGEGEIDVFVSLYVRINQLAKDDPRVREEARGWFRRLEAGDPEARRLWTYFVDRSKKEFQRIYDILGIRHDSDAGEAFYNDKMEPVLARLRAKGLLVQGAKQERAAEDDLGEERAADARPWGVDLGDPKEGGLGFPLLLKSDGGTTYITRDLAAVFYRIETYEPEKIVYVVGAPQTLHFKQLKAILEKLDPAIAAKVVHVPFGQYLGMSTRRGTSVFLAEVLERARVEALKAAEEAKKKSDLTAAEIEENARVIGVGAVRFFDMKSGRMKDIDLSSAFDVLVVPRDAAAKPLADAIVAELRAFEEGWKARKAQAEDEPVPPHPDAEVPERAEERARRQAIAATVLVAGDGSLTLRETKTGRERPIARPAIADEVRASPALLDLERVISPTGETGPYVQYTYARLSGILRKLGKAPTPDVNFALLEEPEAAALVKALSEHPAKVRASLEEHEPSVIARHLLDVAAAANQFIHKHRVIDAEPAVRDARALLVLCAQKVVGQCLEHLGIEPLERM